MNKKLCPRIVYLKFALSVDNCGTTLGRLLLAATRPVADSPNGIKCKVSGTSVYPAEESPVLHKSAGYKFAAREGMSEISSVKTF
jgi:hypothetical protein